MILLIKFLIFLVMKIMDGYLCFSIKTFLCEPGGLELDDEALGGDALGTVGPLLNGLLLKASPCNQGLQQRA